MLKQIDFEMDTGLQYMIFYDSDKMTEEQAIAECEFVGWGKGCNEALFPYYLIVPKEKKPILECIKEYISDKWYDIGYKTRMESEEYLYD
jgi:hypothetical protein